MNPCRIFKYTLEPDRRQMIMLPEAAKPLHVAEQNNMLVLWCEIPVTFERAIRGPLIPRVFVVVTTGDQFNTDGKTYIGTTTLGEWFVAHVYEQTSGYADPIDGRVPEDWAQIKAELNPPPEDLGHGPLS